jgi:NTE family protein
LKRHASKAKVGLALAGGGPLGAIYEIGALCAIEESIVGMDFTQLHGYVGVSAGAVLTAALVNGMSPREQSAAFIENLGVEGDLLEPSALIRPAWREFGRRLSTLPRLAAQAGWDMTVKRRSKLAALERLGRAMPTGVLSGDVLQKQLERMFTMPGRSNDFRDFDQRLTLVATELDTGEAVLFGTPGMDHVPISKAIQASAALPGLFPPVSIDGRDYVDGALKKTVHASVLLDRGVDLLICLNPLVPFDATATRKRVMQRADEPIPSMRDGGLPLVLSQTFRSLIHSRLGLGLKNYELSHPGVDIVLFEPDHRDSAMYVANTFSLSQRRQLAEHAYQSTRDAMRSRRSTLADQLARHNLSLNIDLLNDGSRTLIDPKRSKIRTNGRTALALKRLDATLDDLEDRLGREAFARKPAG